MFVFREALRSIKRTPGTFVMSVLALGIAIGLGAFLVNAAYQAHVRLHETRANLKIEAFFDPAIPSEDAAQIANRQIASMPLVKRIESISKEEALTDFAQSTGENVQEVLGMNPLPASVQVYLKEPTVASADRIKAALEKIGGIANVRTDLSLVKALEERTNLLQTLAAIFGGLCLLATLLFLILAGRFTLMLRMRTESVMDLLGASRSHVRLPLAIESMLAGLFGGLLAAIVLVALQRVLLDRLGAHIIVASESSHIAVLAGGCIAVAILLSLLANRIARLSTCMQ